MGKNFNKDKRNKKKTLIKPDDYEVEDEILTSSEEVEKYYKEKGFDLNLFKLFAFKPIQGGYQKIYTKWNSVPLNEFTLAVTNIGHSIDFSRHYGMIQPYTDNIEENFKPQTIDEILSLLESVSCYTNDINYEFRKLIIGRIIEHLNMVQGFVDQQRLHRSWTMSLLFRSKYWYTVYMFFIEAQIPHTEKVLQKYIKNPDLFKMPYQFMNDQDIPKYLKKELIKGGAQLVMWDQLSKPIAQRMEEKESRKYLQIISDYFLMDSNDNYLWSAIHSPYITILKCCLRIEAEGSMMISKNDELLSEEKYLVFDSYSTLEYGEVNHKEILDVLRNDSLSVEERLNEYEERKANRQTYQDDPQDWFPEFIRYFCFRWYGDVNLIGYKPLVQAPTTKQRTDIYTKWNAVFVRDIKIENFNLEEYRSQEVMLVDNLKNSLLNLLNIVRLDEPRQQDAKSQQNSPQTLNAAVNVSSTRIKKRPLLLEKSSSDEESEKRESVGGRKIKIDDSFTIISTPAVVPLNDLQPETVDKWHKNVKQQLSSNSHFRVEYTIPKDMQNILTPYLQLYAQLHNNCTWQQLLDRDVEKFIAAIKMCSDKYASVDFLATTDSLSIIKKKLRPLIKDLQLSKHKDPNDQSFLRLYTGLTDCYTLYDSIDQNDQVSMKEMISMISALFQQFGKVNVKNHFNNEFFSALGKDVKFDSSFTFALMLREKQYLSAAATVNAAQSGDSDDVSNDESLDSRRKKKSKHSHSTKSNSNKSRSDNTSQKKSGLECWGCGRPNHTRDTCRFTDHPNYNNENKPWKDSTEGREVRKVHSDAVKLLANFQIKNGERSEYDSSASKGSGNDKKKSSYKGSSKLNK